MCSAVNSSEARIGEKALMQGKYVHSSFPYCRSSPLCVSSCALIVASYLTDLRSRILLHHNPLPTTVTCQIITIVVSALVRRRVRVRAQLALSPSAPFALPIFVADLEALSFDDLEREGLPIDTLIAIVLLGLLVERVSVRVGIGRAFENGREHLGEQRFTTGEATADDSDRGFDADDHEENSAVPCK
jgi:hypothetical protein